MRSHGLPAPFGEHTTSCAQESGYSQVFRYQVLPPASLLPGKRYPLVVFLHGAGERGEDGQQHLAWLPARMAEPANRERYECYVLAVQCRSLRQWVDVGWDEAGSTPIGPEPSMDMQRVIAVIEELFAFAAVDRRRVYLTGMSMGGYGAWDLAMRRPAWFAALVPICGGGDEAEAGRIMEIPTWVWHGADDDIVPVSRSRVMVDALRELGAELQYSELEGCGHDSWREAYGPDGVLEWMFTQVLPGNAEPFLVPMPGLGLVSQPGSLVLSGRLVADTGAMALAAVLAAEFEALTGLSFDCVTAERTPEPKRGDLLLRLGDGPAASFVVSIDACCVVSAPDVQGLSAGTAKLLQLVSVEDGDASLPYCELSDRPDSSYRCVSIDCARFPQSIDSLKQVVDLCRFYSVAFLQLHLTDDSAFTFPVDALPGLATEGRSYSKAELRELDLYARDRGVGIIPEFDVPGHSAALVAHDPERFGLADVERNPALAHLTRPEVLAAIRAVIHEMCDVFQSSPYLHFGGDEAWLDGVDQDPDCQSYAEEHGYENAHDLFRAFLNEVYAIVKATGREPIVWEGFRREGSVVALPKDLKVVAWDTQYYRPDHLAADGYPLINASWRPLYLVGGGRLPLHAAPRRWPLEEIYAWQPNRFDHYDPKSAVFGGLTLSAGDHALGGQICVWEQTEDSVILSLEDRLAAFSEKTWHAENGDLSSFEMRIAQLRPRLRTIMRPVTILPRPVGTAVVVPLSGRDRIRIETLRRGIVRYTLDGTEPSATSTVYSDPIALGDRKILVVRSRLFSPAGLALGGCDRVRFVAGAAQSLVYRLYRAPEAGFDLLPDFAQLDSYEHGHLEVVRGGPIAGPLAVVMRGRIRIAEGGAQRFGLRTQDGSVRLLIAGRLVGERSSSADERYTEAEISLETGDHEFCIEYAQGPMTVLCRVRHRSPSQTRWRLIDRLLIEGGL